MMPVERWWWLASVTLSSTRVCTCALGGHGIWARYSYRLCISSIPFSQPGFRPFGPLDRISFSHISALLTGSRSGKPEAGRRFLAKRQMQVESSSAGESSKTGAAGCRRRRVCETVYTRRGWNGRSLPLTTLPCQGLASILEPNPSTSCL